MLTKKLRFFGVHSPLKSIYIGAKRAFRKLLGTDAKYGYLKIVQKGTHLRKLHHIHSDEILSNFCSLHFLSDLNPIEKNALFSDNFNQHALYLKAD